MTRYFYDPSRGMLVAFDEEQNALYTLAEAANGMMLPALDVSQSTEFSSLVPAKQPRKKGRGCDECGSKGARHFKTCPQASGVKKKPIDQTRHSADGIDEEAGNDAWDALGDLPRDGIMSRSQYIQVRAAEVHGLTLEIIAKEMRLTTSEVLKALDAKNYERYSE